MMVMVMREIRDRRGNIHLTLTNIDSRTSRAELDEVNINILDLRSSRELGRVKDEHGGLAAYGSDLVPRSCPSSIFV